MAGSIALVAPLGAVLGNLAGGLVAKVFGVQAMFLFLAPLFGLASAVLSTPGTGPAVRTATEGSLNSRKALEKQTKE